MRKYTTSTPNWTPRLHVIGSIQHELLSLSNTPIELVWDIQLEVKALSLFSNHQFIIKNKQTYIETLNLVSQYINSKCVIQGTFEHQMVTLDRIILYIDQLIQCLNLSFFFFFKEKQFNVEIILSYAKIRENQGKISPTP